MAAKKMMQVLSSLREVSFSPKEHLHGSRHLIPQFTSVLVHGNELLLGHGAITVFQTSMQITLITQCHEWRRAWL